MKKIMTLVIVVSLLFPSGALLAKERQGAQLEITKTDGTEIKGELIAVKQDSALLLESSSRIGASIDISDIKVIKIVKKSGLYWGAGLGLALGAIGGGALGHHGANPDNLMSLIGKDVMATLLTGAFGALIVGLVGAEIGNSLGGSKTFQIEEKSQEQIKAFLEKLRTQARIPEYQ
jgi:uncharacterized membrane protein YeaQ/YmgE (transglycosylase-associated protein family)